MPPYNQVVDRGSMRVGFTTKENQYLFLRNTIFQRTGSFGGVPVMYRGRSADDKYYGTPGYAGSQGSSEYSSHSCGKSRCHRYCTFANRVLKISHFSVKIKIFK